MNSLECKSLPTSLIFNFERVSYFIEVMSMTVGLCMSQCPQRPEVSDPLGARAADIHELGAENQTLVLCKRGTCPSFWTISLALLLLQHKLLGVKFRSQGVGKRIQRWGRRSGKPPQALPFPSWWFSPNTSCRELHTACVRIKSRLWQKGKTIHSYYDSQMKLLPLFNWKNIFIQYILIMRFLSPSFSHETFF